MSGGEISVGEIARLLDQRVASLAHELLPAARKAGAYLEAGSIDGEPGASLKVNLQGAMAGKWTDFSAADGTPERSGDMLKMVALVRFGGAGKEGLAQAIAWAKSYLGLDTLDPNRLATVRRAARARAANDAAAAREDEAGKRDRAWSLWFGADPIARTPALAYLETRGIDLTRLGKAPGSLRYRPDVWCPERRGKFPAMLAAIIALDGKHVGTHRTYLDIAGWSHRTKTGPVSVVKVQHPRTGRWKSHKLTLGRYYGGHIPLWKGASPATLREVPRGTPIHVSEGIEDGLTIALARPDARVVAGVALANIGGLMVPDQAGPIVFVGQNDPADSKAAEAFERAVARQQAAGRTVRTFFPPAAFKDFNDQLLGKRVAA